MHQLQGIHRTMLKLATTTNESSASVLEAAVDGPSLAVRRAAVGAFGRREDRMSQRRFLNLFRRLEEDELDLLHDLPRNFRRTLLEILDAGDVAPCEAACHLLVQFSAYEELPTLVKAAATPGHAWADGLASAVLLLARGLYEEINDYRQHPEGRDPSFARHWAANALGHAVEKYKDHERVELVDAFLLVATRENPTLKRIIALPDHACHDVLLDALRRSHSTGVAEFLAHAFENPDAPTVLLEVASDRTDAHFRREFLTVLGYPVSQRALDGALRVRKIKLLENPDEEWLKLAPKAQSAAIQLIAAARYSRRTKLDAIDFFLHHGASEVRLVACESLTGVDGPEAMDRLEKLIDDDDPLLVAAAAKLLRRKGHAEAVPKLATLLNHQNLSVRTTAQSALRDFTFIKYMAAFDSYDAESAKQLGRIVARTDDEVIEKLQLELMAATILRKARGLEMAVAMGVVDRVLSDLLKLVEHKDAEIRCGALTALGESHQQVAREAIVAATGDPNTLVRNRAAEALKRFDRPEGASS